jgi:hypothetical protein
MMDMLQTDPSLRKLRNLEQANRANTGMNAAIVAKAINEQFEKPYKAGSPDMDTETGKRQKDAITIYNSYVIHGSDPKEIAAQVKKETDKTWAAITREAAAVGPQ